MNDNSILDTIKKLLGIQNEAFDTDIIIHINSTVTIYLPLDLWQPAIGMGHLVA